MGEKRVRRLTKPQVYYQRYCKSQERKDAYALAWDAYSKDTTIEKKKDRLNYMYEWAGNLLKEETPEIQAAVEAYWVASAPETKKGRKQAAKGVTLIGDELKVEDAVKAKEGDTEKEDGATTEGGLAKVATEGEGMKNPEVNAGVAVVGGQTDGVGGSAVFIPESVKETLRVEKLQKQAV